MAVCSHLILWSLTCLVTIVHYTQAVPVPRGATVHDPQGTTLANRHRNGGIRTLLATAHNFSSVAEGLRLVLRGKRLNKGNLKLVTADLLIIAHLLHGQSFEDRMYVWGKTAVLCATSGKKHMQNNTTYDVEVLDKFEGDIILERADIDNIMEDSIPAGLETTSPTSGGRVSRVKRKMVAGETKYWTGEIPWKIHDSKFTHSQVDTIKAAIRHWEQLTCVRFRDITDPDMKLAKDSPKPPLSPRARSRTYLGFADRAASKSSMYSDSTSPNIPHLRFIQDQGCYSYTGKVGHNGQDISIGSECNELGIVAHEIGHAIGFYHEHNRPDRDNYITINYNNIARDHNGNFRLVKWDDLLTLGIPYDYSSLMHYSGTEWSTTGGKLTLVAKEKEMQKVMGQREQLSFYDVKLANFMFCSVACTGYKSLDWEECQHGGYRNPNACDQCLCPTGWAGPKCAEVEPAKNAFCGEKVLTASEDEQTLTSPSFDSITMKTEVTCAWHIKANAGARIHLSIAEQFDIGYEQYSCEEYVEIRYKGTNDTGIRLCSSNATIKDIVSYDNEVLVLFRSVPLQAKDSNSRWFRISYSVTDGCGGCSAEQTSVVIKPCRRRELYDCSPDTNRKNSCYREVFYCCPPYTLQGDHCRIQEFKAPAAKKEAWGLWSNWTTCSATCGGCGWKSRERQCLQKRCRGFNQEWARCGFNACPAGTTPQRDVTSGLCKVEELDLCPSQNGYKQCIQKRYEPCPEDGLTQPCCVGYKEDETTGTCVPEGTTTTTSAR